MNAGRTSSIVTLLRVLEGASPAMGRDQALDDALIRLGRTRSVTEAHKLDREIAAIWGRSRDVEARASFERAADALGSGNFETARISLQETIDLDPLFAEAWNLRATLWFLLGEHSKALADLARVLVLEPRQYSALSAIGHILMRENEFDGAERAFRSALAINPHFSHARDALTCLATQRSEKDSSTGDLTL